MVGFAANVLAVGRSHVQVLRSTAHQLHHRAWLPNALVMAFADCVNGLQSQPQRRRHRKSHATLTLLLLSLCLLVHAIPPGPEAHALTKSMYSGVELGPPYNPRAETTEANHCDAQLVVLGLHGSRTSIVARLMTLLGALRAGGPWDSSDKHADCSTGFYAGQADDLIVNEHNTGMLKHWEVGRMMDINDDFLSHATHPSTSTDPLHAINSCTLHAHMVLFHTIPPTPDYTQWTGIGYTGAYQPEAVREQLITMFHNDVLPRLNRHCPWVVKDPRLCFTSQILLRCASKEMCALRADELCLER